MQSRQADVESQLSDLIAAGFHDAEEALLVLEDAIAEVAADEVWRVELSRLAEEHQARKVALERTWVDYGVNDRIDAAFLELSDLHIIALQNAGYTIGEGWEEVAAVAVRRPGQRGAVFFHEQDTARGLAGEGLMLAFGALSRDDEPSTDGDAVAIGHDVCKVLRLHGLTVEWNGQVDTRLHIPPFPWRKRRYSVASGHAVLLFACAIEHRMQVLKTCRAVLGLDLTTAKAGLDSLKPRTYRWDTSPPWVVMRGLSRADARRYAEALIAAGAEVQVR